MIKQYINTKTARATAFAVFAFWRNANVAWAASLRLQEQLDLSRAVTSSYLATYEYRKLGDKCSMSRGDWRLSGGLKWCLLFLVGLFFSLNNLTAQTDTLQLPEIEISTRQNQFSNSANTTKFNQKDLEKNPTTSLADLLAQQSDIPIKTYGLGTLATLSTRGTSASHTALLWNGFNLQSPMNGTTDLALVPTYATDKVHVQKGAASALYGSGAIGGAIFLENKLPQKEGWQGALGTTIGSFSERHYQGKIAFRKKGWGSDFRLFQNSAENDFLLKKDSDNYQINAAQNTTGFLQNNHFQLADNQSFRTFFWRQNTKRKIPPSRTEATSDAQQNDDWWRMGAEYVRIGEQQVLKARAAWLDERLLYFSSVIDSSYSRTKSLITEVENDWAFDEKSRLNVGINFTRNQAFAAAVGDNPSRNRAAIFASFKQTFFQEKLNTTLSAREELVNEKLLTPTASLAVAYLLKKQWQTHFSAARSFNLPTFNDLYWQSSGANGNLTLEPEAGWNFDAGVRNELKINDLEIENGITFFSNYIENLILWAPSGGIWRPENKKNVWARGLETKHYLTYQKKDWRSKVGGNMSLTKSTVEAIYDNEDPIFLGKQLIYVPLFSANATAEVQWKNTSLFYRHSFTGKRYTTTDNAQDEALPFFSVGTISLRQKIKVKAIVGSIQLEINNLYNADYEVIKARKMPFRYGRVTFNVNW